MPRLQGRVDPNQPSPRAMHFIKNKNNITDLKLRRTLESFDREKIQSITTIDHDRLDVKDFLKEVKYCASDQLPESRLWLGDKGDARRKRDQQSARRNLFTAPAGASKTRGDSRDIKTAPAQGEENHTQEDMVQVGIFLKKKSEVDPNKVHMDIYSKRNMYSSLQRERTGEFSDAAKAQKEEEEKRQRAWKEEAEKQRKEEEEREEREEQERKAAIALAEEQRRTEAADLMRLQRSHSTSSVDSETRRRSGIRAEMRRIAGTAPQSELEKREARIRAMNDNAELMKEILILNAKKRASKKKVAQPLEDRIRTFFTRIEEIQKIRDLEDVPPTNIEQQRRYVLMTKGVKAALEIKDDDDDSESPIHTL